MKKATLVALLFLSSLPSFAATSTLAVRCDGSWTDDNGVERTIEVKTNSAGDTLEITDYPTDKQPSAFDTLACSVVASRNMFPVSSIVAQRDLLLVSGSLVNVWLTIQTEAVLGPGQLYPAHLEIRLNELKRTAEETEIRPRRYDLRCKKERQNTINR